MLITEKKLRSIIRSCIFESSQDFYDHQAEYELDNQEYEDYVSMSGGDKKIEAYLCISAREHISSFEPGDEDPENISFSILDDVIRNIFNYTLPNDNFYPWINDAVYAIQENIVSKHLTKDTLNRENLKESCKEAMPAILNAIKDKMFYKVFDFLSNLALNIKTLNIKNKIKKELGSKASEENIDNLISYTTKMFKEEVESGTPSDIAVEDALDYLKGFYDFD